MKLIAINYIYWKLKSTFYGMSFLPVYMWLYFHCFSNIYAYRIRWYPCITQWYNNNTIAYYFFSEMIIILFQIIDQCICCHDKLSFFNPTLTKNSVNVCIILSKWTTTLLESQIKLWNCHFCSQKCLKLQ